ncbi:MAG: hypothetical protein J6Z29_08140 [Ruminococcus sp.]|jgi:collagenase-like PrtC family protease|nr:hypothetical protein [Ruminococcus albus]MBP5268524.1 hypothetical protein [Ruminococcus sp.]
MRVRFHLPDFAGHFRFNLIFAEMLKRCPEYFREGVEIASVYGCFPPSLWNGGRFCGGYCDKDYVKTVVSSFNERGIPLRFTFTNPMIEKKHLSDDFCNMVMNVANNGLNEAIVFSPILEEYIRKQYPKYKLTSSTCKRITDPDAMYAEVEKDYHIVVIDYDLNNKFDILEKIPDKEKCEILVNACCDPACARRSEHYRTIGLQQIDYANHVKKHPANTYSPDKLSKLHPEIEQFNKCSSVNRTIFDIQDLSTHVTPDDIWNKYVPMGFSQFKIEGRTYETLNLLEHYMYYMIKPECKDIARFTFLRQLRANGVLELEE